MLNRYAECCGAVKNPWNSKNLMEKAQLKNRKISCDNLKFR